MKRLEWIRLKTKGKGKMMSIKNFIYWLGCMWGRGGIGEVLSKESNLDWHPVAKRDSRF